MELTGQNRVVIAFGSNIGDKEENIRKAIIELEKTCGKVAQVSSLYKTEPMGFESKNQFINGCLLLLTNFAPHILLQKLKEIEVSLGRIKTSLIYEDRTIDLDIILYESLFINTPDLQIPHPKLHDRPFVVEPLKELNLGFNPF